MGGSHKSRRRRFVAPVVGVGALQRGCFGLVVQLLPSPLFKIIVLEFRAVTSAAAATVAAARSVIDYVAPRV